jgi:hypothetical protein
MIAAWRQREKQYQGELWIEFDCGQRGYEGEHHPADNQNNRERQVEPAGE